MIRVYIDWGVYSNLKREEYSEIKNFIQEHKGIFQYPYTPAHFSDLMKSYKPGNDKFYEDLNLLQEISENHLLRWEIKDINICRATPKEYFEQEKHFENNFDSLDIEKLFNDLNDEELGLGNVGEILKSLFKLVPAGIPINDVNNEMIQKMFPSLNNKSSMWDFMKDMVPFSKKILLDKGYYKDFRNSIGETGFKLGENSGNWDVNDVINKINEIFKKYNTNLTFKEYVNTCFSNRKEQVTNYEYYTTAYLLLDMIGYKSDKLPKPTDNMMNIQTDAEHSFYSAYCDYFIVLDKKLSVKTKVLFKEFNILTIVLSPFEFIETVKGKIYNGNKNKDFIKESIQIINEGILVEKYVKNDNIEVNTYVYKLPLYYFNFFNYGVLYDYSEDNGIIIEFKKVFKNYSTFIFYSEVEQLLKLINDFFDLEENEEFQLKRQKFIYCDKDVKFELKLQYGIVQLTLDDDTCRPVLKYIIKIDNKTSTS